MGIAALQHKAVALPRVHGSWPGESKPDPNYITYPPANPNKSSGFGWYDKCVPVIKPGHIGGPKDANSHSMANPVG
jgi:hypothetical protein